MFSLAVQVERAAAERRRKSRRDLLLRVGSVVALLAAWEVAGFFTPVLFLAPLHATLVAFYRLVRDSTLIVATLNSVWILICGLAISVVLGVAVGLAMGRYRRVAWILDPYVNGLYATPTIAFLPLLSLWFGLYSGPKIAMVVLFAVFPIIKNTYVGAANVGQEFLEPATSMSASEVQISRLVIVPACVPYIMAGLRLSVGRGVVGLVVGEFFTAQTGLGGLIGRFASNFKTAEMFVPIIVLVSIGYGLTAIVARLQSVFAPWKETERDLGI